MWRLFSIVLISVSVASAGDVSCRDWKPGVTECNPYAGTFFKILKLKKDFKSLRNRPVTSKRIPITKKIRVRNGITLDNLIHKYIKREERLYKKTEKKRYARKHQNKIKMTLNLQKIVPKNITIQKEKVTAQAKVPQEKIMKDIQVVKKPQEYISSNKIIEQKPLNHIAKKLLVEKKSEKQVLKKKVSLSEKKPMRTEVIALPKAVILTPVKDSNESILLNDETGNRGIKKLAEEVILPAELVADKDTKSKKIKKRNVEFASYVVQKGDSLAGISKKFGIDIANLTAINQLNRKNTLKVGQVLQIPLTQGDVNAIASASYVVKRGDTLSKIAKHFHVKLKDIIKYNRIKKRAMIHVGQKLILPLPYKLVELKRIEEKKRKERLKKKRERERLARIALKKRQKAKFLREAKGLKRKLSVTATAYTSHRGQTDKTPFLAAWNNRIRPGMKIIAVSRDLITKYGITNGSRVRISGLKGIYTVRDKMNKKWRRKIDIYMGTSRWRALRWGKRRVTLYY